MKGITPSTLFDKTLIRPNESLVFFVTTKVPAVLTKLTVVSLDSNAASTLLYVASFLLFFKSYKTMLSFAFGLFVSAINTYLLL